MVLLATLLLGGNRSSAGPLVQTPVVMTVWVQLPEYPRQQLVRADWLDLNGLWQFEPGVILPFGRNAEFFRLVSP